MEAYFANPVHPKQWQWNPYYALLELCFGVRLIPTKVVCDACDDYLLNRLYYFCTQCRTFHDARIYDGNMELFFWEGYFCQNCGAQMALERGPIAKLLFFVTKPIWWLPWKLLGPKILKWNKTRMAERLKHTKVSEDETSLLWVPPPGEANKDPNDIRAKIIVITVALIFWVPTYYFVFPDVLRPYPIQSALLFLMVGFALVKVVKQIEKERLAELYWRPRDVTPDKEARKRK